MQTIPVPVETYKFVLLLYCIQFQSLYKHISLSCYSNADSSSPCTNIQLLAVTVLQTVPVPVQSYNVELLRYCSQFQSLYKHVALCFAVLQTVSVPIKTYNVQLLPYCRQFHSMYNHVTLCCYRTVDSSIPCTNINLCAVNVLQTVSFHIKNV